MVKYYKCLGCGYKDLVPVLALTGQVHRCCNCGGNSFETKRLDWNNPADARFLEAEGFVNPAVAKIMRLCHKCGYENDPSNLWCPKCGQKFDENT